MEQQGLEPKDLVPLLGGRSRVSEVLSGRRNLSLKMIRNLVQHLGIPAEVSSASPEPQILALSALLLPINAEIWFCALNRGANRT
jgi:hypothetical protein